MKSNEESDANEFADGFARVESEVRAVPERELLAINIDVPSAVTTVLGALPELRGLREKFAQLLGFDVGRFDKLRDYALALGHAHAMFRAAVGPSDGVSELADEVSALRDMLQADAMALAKRKILNEAQVTKVRGGSGYKNVAFEVVALVGMFRENWEAIQGRSALKAVRGRGWGRGWGRGVHSHCCWFAGVGAVRAVLKDAGMRWRRSHRCFLAPLARSAASRWGRCVCRRII